MAQSYGFLLLVLVKTVASSSPVGPVIGIMTQPFSDNTSYIAASYVKFLESAGARVVPIPFNAPLANLTTLFAQLNGLLYPGGGADLADPTSPFLVAATHLYNLALASNDQGNYFPLWGTCLGFQTLSVMTAKSSSVLASGFDSENLPLTLDMMAAAKSSRIYGTAPAEIYTTLTTEAVTMNNHQDGVTPASFTSNPNLAAFYNLLSTNVDRKGRPFASTIEGKNYPVYGVQWHPEKNAWEWTPNEDIPHSATAVAVCEYMAKFFVDEARKSKVVTDYNTLMELVIWNYSPVFTGLTGSGFSQTYFWPI